MNYHQCHVNPPSGCYIIDIVHMQIKLSSIILNYLILYRSCPMNIRKIEFIFLHQSSNSDSFSDTYIVKTAHTHTHTHTHTGHTKSTQYYYLSLNNYTHHW